MKLSIASALVRRHAVELTGSYHGNVANPRHFIAAILWTPVFLRQHDICNTVRCSLELAVDIHHELMQIPDMLNENNVDLDEINSFLSRDLSSDYCLIEGKRSVVMSLSAQKMFAVAASQAESFGYDRIYVPHLFYAAIRQAGPKWLPIIQSILITNSSVMDRVYDCMAAGGNTGVGSV